MLLLFIAIPAMVFADVVTEQDALLKARQFMPGKSFEQPQKPNRAPAKDGKIENPAYFVFNATNNEGFVIVSADDRTEAILGYSDNGYFDQDNMPSNMKAWFEFYEQSIRSLGDAPAQAPQNRSSRAAIEPLIQTKWYHKEPYNLQCPMDGEKLTDAGYIATALAQVMYYHKWPVATTEEIPSYNTTNNIYVDALPPTTFKWDLMKNQYGSDAAGDSVNAVAELIRYCGQIHQMDYNTNSSRPEAFYLNNIYRYFNYSGNMNYAQREFFTNDRWEDLVYEELKNNRPVIYTGDSYMFVCDGYDGNGMFHINWGTSGRGDGFYKLSILNWNNDGIEGGNNWDGYNSNQWIVQGFAPATDQEKLVPQVMSFDVGISQSEYARATTELDFESISLSGTVYAYYNLIAPQQTLDIETGWALYKDDSFVQCLGYQEQTLPATIEYELNNNMTVSFGTNLEDGQYRIYQVYRLSGETEWTICRNTNTECLIVDIAGNSMAIRLINYSVDIIKVNSLTPVGTAIKNQKSYVKANITNNGETYLQTITIESRKKGLMGSKTSLITTYLNPGETSDVILSFTPISSGIYVVTVGDVTIEVPVIESILTISDISTSMDPIVNVPFKLLFNLTYHGSETVDYYYYRLRTKAEGEDSWTEGDWKFVYQMIPEVPVAQSIELIPSSTGTFEIEILTWYNGEEPVIGTFTTTVASNAAVQYVTIDGITYLCNNLTHKSMLLEWDKETLLSPELIIPSSITHKGVDYQVTAIADSAFFISWGNNYKGVVRTIIISEGIETIGDCAFYSLRYFGNNTSALIIDLPSTIKKIGSWAFYGAKYINSRMNDPIPITLGQYNATFAEAENATICIPAGTKNKYKNTAGWSSFTDYYEGTIHQSVIDTERYLLYYPSMKAGLVEFIPSKSHGTTSEDLTADHDVRIPSTITFREMVYNVTSIDTPVDKYRSSIYSIELPSTLNSICNQAFYNCKSLKTVITYNETPLNNIEDVFPFSDFYNTTELWVPSGTAELYKKTSGWNKFDIILEHKDILLMGEIKEATIDGITYSYGTESTIAHIKKAAKNTPLENAVPSSVTIDGVEYSVTAIDDEAYMNSIKQKYHTTGGWGGSWIYEGTLVIPEGIKKIGFRAFQQNYYVALELPSSLIVIGEMAFYQNEKLKKVTVKSEKPPVSKGDIFSFSEGENPVWIDTLYVPGGAVDKYKAASAWKKIKTITDATTLTAKSYSRKYGQDAPTFDFTYEGAPVTGVPSITCSATKKTPVGTYPIKIGRGSVINSIKDTINGTLTITKAPLTITANSYTIKQGDPIPPLGVTYKGFVNDEDSTVLTKLPTLTTFATSSGDPGEYEIKVSGAEAQNYGISYVKGKITIERNTAITDITNDNIVSVYTLSGTMLYNNVEIEKVYDQLPSGIYIIRQKDQKTRKLIK